MQKVNIYIASTIKGPREQKGKYCYVLELDREGKEPVTLTKTAEISGTENGTAVQILLEVLKRLTMNCYLHIYTDSGYISSALDSWLKKWWNAGWKNAKGEEISHMEEWREIAEILVGNEISVHLREEHSYRTWQQSELQKG